MASEILMSISKDEVEKARLRSMLKYQLDLQSDMAYERQQGILEGEAKGKQEILKLLKSGKSPEEILREYGTE